MVRPRSSSARTTTTSSSPNSGSSSIFFGATATSTPVAAASPAAAATTSTLQSPDATLFGRSAISVKKEENVLCEQVNEKVVKQSIVQTPCQGPGEKELQIASQDQKGDGWVVVETTTMPTTRTSLDSAAGVSTVEATTDTTGAPKVESVVPSNLVVTPPGNKVEVDQKKPCENASSEAGAHGDGTQTSAESSLLIDVNGYNLSPHNGSIIKKVFAKYGDITSGSILESTAAKSIFLELVAGVVDGLCTPTLDTLGWNELQRMKRQVADAAKVGFHVEWLRKRVEEIEAVPKRKVRMEELRQQIDAASKALIEIELQHAVLTKEFLAIQRGLI